MIDTSMRSGPEGPEFVRRRNLACVVIRTSMRSGPEGPEFQRLLGQGEAAVLTSMRSGPEGPEFQPRSYPRAGPVSNFNEVRARRPGIPNRGGTHVPALPVLQ